MSVAVAHHREQNMSPTAALQARPVASRPVARPVTTRPPSTASTPSTPSSSSSSSRPPPVAAYAVAGKDTSSSSGKIFAKPSKEWVLPERAKPGRKASTTEPENKRQSQNRLSQRAHRARRTDYIQTLEERLRQYEADEIHSNVRLQEVARALKADNEKAKEEITQLRTTLATARKERETWITERRALTDTVRALRAQLAQLDATRPLATSPHIEDRLEHELAALTRSPVPATPTVLAHPQRRQSGLTCPICPDPDPDCPCQQRVDSPVPAHMRGADATLTTSMLNSSPRCGLCDLVPDACLCHPEEEDVKPVIPRSPSMGMDMGDLGPGPSGDASDCGLCTSESFCACRAAAAAMASSPATSKSNNSLPAVVAQVAAPAVPLRLRARPAAKQSVWVLDNVPAGTSRAEAVCTGDPSNCDACKNDTFGQEFCGHLFGKNESGCAGCASGKCGPKTPTQSGMSIASMITGPVPSPSPSAPGTPTASFAARLVLACCGAPELCGHAAGCAGTVSLIPPPPLGEDEETIRPDEAWKRLKAHPNAAFTPLAVLADVVARRDKVAGPRVELSPPPSARVGELRGKRRLAVETSAVRDALRYLDSATPAPESPGSPVAKRRKV